MTAVEALVRQVRANRAADVSGPHGIKDAPSVKDAPRVRRPVC
jgi:hypothetical protein